jgi:hypothetical protein
MRQLGSIHLKRKPVNAAKRFGMMEDFFRHLLGTPDK